MSRFANRTSQLVIDLSVLALAFMLAMLFRFDWDVPRNMFRRLIIVLPYVVLIQYTFLTAFGVTRFSWRFISLRDVTRIFIAIAAATAVLLAIRFAADPLTDVVRLARYGIVPIGVILADFVLALLGITGVRALRRLIGEDAASRKQASPAQLVPTILIGAGQGGLLVAQEIRRRPDLGISPIAFVDDDPIKVGSVIHGVRVLGTTDDLSTIVNRYDVKQALITISSAPGSAIRRIRDKCTAIDLTVKIVPGTYQIVDGRVNLSRIREVAIEDLLRRDPVRLDSQSVQQVVRGQTVLVTGAGGSIGSELCRQALSYEPGSLVLVEQAENNLFEVHQELRERYDDAKIHPCIADITDSDRMAQIFAEHRPRLVYHAAAHKHVPMMEWNPAEAIKNNTIGSQIVSELAHRHRVERFVMVSTDKAVNPTSVMGASKRAAELYVQALSKRSDTNFATVRFGNVLGSAGSVIPIFRKQIQDGGPVTVTHPDMKRYFMTIPEAVQLVMQAAALSHGGEIFILDMGEPVRIVDLAEDLIRLSGLEPGRDVEVQFTGVRPGEKLFEELSTQGEGIGRTSHPKIFIGQYASSNLDAIRHQFEALAALCKTGDPAMVREALADLVPEYTSFRDRSNSGFPPMPAPADAVEQA